MALPSSIKASFNKLPKDQQRAFRRELQRRRRGVLGAYICWLCLGSHYWYLGDVGGQWTFWLTGGYCFVGWIIDFFRVPAMVKSVNEDLARKLMLEHRELVRE